MHKVMCQMFDGKYGFISRHGGSIRYASDPINGLLNYGYTVLAGEVCKYVNGLGLELYYGFFHVTHNSFQALKTAPRTSTNQWSKLS